MSNAMPAFSISCAAPIFQREKRTQPSGSCSDRQQHHRYKAISRNSRAQPITSAPPPKALFRYSGDGIFPRSRSFARLTGKTLSVFPSTSVVSFTRCIRQPILCNYDANPAVSVSSSEVPAPSAHALNGPPSSQEAGLFLLRPTSEQAASEGELVSPPLSHSTALSSNLPCPVTTAQNPIGAFDSGVGGLSILQEIRTLLPSEDLIYFADSAYCPYGDKPESEIRARTLQVAQYLVSLGAKAIVVACNSACAAGLEEARAVLCDVPIVGVEPALKPAHDASRKRRVGVLATTMTLQAAKFSALLKRYGNDLEVCVQAAPGLVEAVESGSVDDDVVEGLLKGYLGPLLEQDVDTIVLGCTHYPFLRPVVERICGEEVLILDTGAAVARQTARVLAERGLRRGEENVSCHGDRTGKTTFYSSGEIVKITPVIRKLWADDTVFVKQIQL